MSIGRISRVGRVARVSGGSAASLPASASGNLIADFRAGPTWMFSDDAGTIPCNVGDVVECWKDQSGSAISFTQMLAESTARKMQQDASGKYYLDLGGGANDYLISAANAAFDGAVGGCVGLACRPGTQVQTLFAAVSFGDGTSTATFMVLRGNGDALHTTKWQSHVGGQSVNTTPADTDAYVAGTDVRITGRVEPVTLDTHRLFKNGVQVATTARSAGMPTTTGSLALGTQVGSLTRVYVGRVYGLVAYSRDLTEAEATALDLYLASLMP